MSVQFRASAAPADPLIHEIAAAAPADPYSAAAYREALRRLGFRPWVLSLWENEQLLSACNAFSQSSYLDHVLMFPTLPLLPPGDLFWRELKPFCRRTGITHLRVKTSALSSAGIPALPDELSRATRYEYLLDLQKPCLWHELSSNHKRNITAARSAGLQLRETTALEACREHQLLMRASLDRRQERGEAVPEEIDLDRLMAPILANSGRLFQAVRDGKTLSSVLVLLADRGAYYQSAGTSPEGMACGASQFAIFEMAQALRNRGLEVLNLGGADPAAAGLQRFKLGFGSARASLESAEFYVGSRMRRTTVTALRLLRHSPRRFLGTLTPRLARIARRLPGSP